MEAWGLDDILEHATDITVYIGHAELTLVYALDNLVYLSWLTGFHKVVSGVNLSYCGQSLANANPVGHHDSLESPVIAKNLSKQVVITHRVLTINLIIRSHDGPGVTLADGNLKATEI